ncbi:hypothetical protein GGR56DRAFT_661982 [Xylariaceae sp. FL0804]|nr:hypothetical protein GGR56DRAFT_661982 [Xylariaceae sp. FL0804]
MSAGTLSTADAQPSHATSPDSVTTDAGSVTRGPLPKILKAGRAGRDFVLVDRRRNALKVSCPSTYAGRVQRRPWPN